MEADARLGVGGGVRPDRNRGQIGVTEVLPRGISNLVWGTRYGWGTR